MPLGLHLARSVVGRLYPYGVGPTHVSTTSGVGSVSHEPWRLALGDSNITREAGCACVVCSLGFPAGPVHRGCAQRRNMCACVCALILSFVVQRAAPARLVRAPRLPSHGQEAARAQGYGGRARTPARWRSKTVRTNQHNMYVLVETINRETKHDRRHTDGDSRRILVDDRGEARDAEEQCALGVQEQEFHRGRERGVLPWPEKTLGASARTCPEAQSPLRRHGDDCDRDTWEKGNMQSSKRTSGSTREHMSAHAIQSMCRKHQSHSELESGTSGGGGAEQHNPMS